MSRAERLPCVSLNYPCGQDPGVWIVLCHQQARVPACFLPQWCLPDWGLQVDAEPTWSSPRVGEKAAHEPLQKGV